MLKTHFERIVDYSTLKGRDSVITLFNRRFIICTPAKSGNLVNLNCQEKGETKQKQKDTENLKKIFRNLKSQKIHNLEKLYLYPAWVGAFMVSFLAASMFLSIPETHAANSLSENYEIARQVIANATPTLAPVETSQEFNDLAIPNDGYMAKPLIAETEISKVEKNVTRVASIKPKVQTLSVSKIVPTSDDVRAWSFPYGYCTYYASTRRFVPWGGNAISWLSGAKKFGFSTGGTPQAGAIIVTSEGGYTGHVGYVESVNGDQVTISEMNYRGFGAISSRTISSSYGAIMGYIY